MSDISNHSVFSGSKYTQACVFLSASGDGELWDSPSYPKAGKESLAKWVSFCLRPVFVEIGGKMARYGKAAQKTVRSAMRRRKRGTLKSGKGGKGGTVKSRKQAIAIGLSEARKKGAKVPRKKSN